MNEYRPYKFYYANYSFEIATQLCLEEAQRLIDLKIEQRLELYKQLDNIKNFGIIPTMNTMLTAYDVISRQIHDLIKEEGRNRGVILDDYGFSEKAKQDVAGKEELDDIKNKLFTIIGSPYGISIQCGMEIMRADTKEEINNILNRYNNGK